MGKFLGIEPFNHPDTILKFGGEHTHPGPTLDLLRDSPVGVGGSGGAVTIGFDISPHPEELWWSQRLPLNHFIG